MIVILQKSQPEELLLHGRMVVVSVIINRNCIGPLVLMSGWLYGRIYENEFITKLILVMFVKMLTNSYSCILWYSDGYCFLLVFFFVLAYFWQNVFGWFCSDHDSLASFIEQEFVSWRFWKICKILQKFLWAFHEMLHRVFQKMFNLNFVEFAEISKLQFCLNSNEDYRRSLTYRR